MNLIVAVDNNWAIGSKNELLIRIPNDHKHFREETTGKVVVLGRKTLETFPQGMPLKNRINIILSKDPNYQVKDAIVVHSIEELLEELKKYDEENIYIIGGESIYRQMLPYCDVAHVTEIDMPTRRMPISRIWTVILSGRLPQTVTSRSILTLPISS